MDHKRFFSVLLSALLAVTLLAGCGGSASSSSEKPASGPASASASASSEALPDSMSAAATPDRKPGSFEENSPFALSGVEAAFAPCLGWGPGTAGTSLKSVIAAASLLHWAEDNSLANSTPELIGDAILPWYEALDELQQQGFAEAWPLIRTDAERLLTDKDSMTGCIEDAGLSAADLPGCTEKNWNALQEVLDGILPEVQGEY